MAVTFPVLLRQQYCHFFSLSLLNTDESLLVFYVVKFSQVLERRVSEHMCNPVQCPAEHTLQEHQDKNPWLTTHCPLHSWWFPKHCNSSALAEPENFVSNAQHADICNSLGLLSFLGNVSAGCGRSLHMGANWNTFDWCERAGKPRIPFCLYKG